MTDPSHLQGEPPSSRRLLAWTAVALALASLIVVGAILPAEFNRDPLGLGRMTGLDRLWAPRQVEVAPTVGAQAAARDYANAWRTDVVQIPLASGDSFPDNELEYKVRMRPGSTLVYSWSVAGLTDPEEFYYDFHGHTVEAQETMTVSTYKQATGLSGNGALTAPFEGVHGWYLQNQGAGPAVVTLKIAGFYELIPPGEVGNEAGILANKPASEARATPAG